jgi:hypothetical protein
VVTLMGDVKGHWGARSCLGGRPRGARCSTSERTSREEQLDMRGGRLATLIVWRRSAGMRLKVGRHLASRPVLAQDSNGARPLQSDAGLVQRLMVPLIRSHEQAKPLKQVRIRSSMTGNQRRECRRRGVHVTRGLLERASDAQLLRCSLTRLPMTASVTSRRCSSRDGAVAGHHSARSDCPRQQRNYPDRG